MISEQIGRISTLTLDDFTWTGVDVYALKEDGTRSGWGYSCCSEEAAMKRKDELLRKYSAVV
ncbi:MAG: hypothetical protein LIP12_06640, partial [Clostridiales bacterium]|nr:hypothetical protein [Clostridiales bacterium]